MKILHIITSLDTGGAEKLMVDLLPRLQENEVEAELAIFDGTRTPFYEDLEKRGVKVIPLSNNSVSSPLHIIRLMRLLPKYDIVHSHNGWCQLYVAIASIFCKATLCTTEHSNTNHRRRWKWYKQIDRWMYVRYKKIICISDAVKANLHKEVGVKEDKLKVVYNGIDVGRYANATPIEEYLKYNKNKKLVVMVAGFRKMKDQDTLIKAMALLPESYELWLAGDGERRAEIESLVASLNLENRVKLLGVRTDLPSILKTADVVVMSSHSEGFGLAAVEGMAAGRPVIASNVPGLAEIVAGAGLLFEHADPQSLKTLIEEVCSDKEYYERVADKCQERAWQYDISSMVKSYITVYKEITNSKYEKISDKT